jgi:hypothetical protein
MPMYLFHVNDGHGAADDQEGLEFPDDRAARDYAVAAARDMLAHAVLAGDLPLDDVIHVMTTEGRPACEVRFGDAVQRI